MLLDTSGLFCYFDEAAPHHAESDVYVAAAADLLTHSYVLAEFVPLTESRRLDRQKALEFVTEIQDNPSFDVVYVDESLHRAAVALLRQRLDKAWSLCDAVSFLLMKMNGVAEALTTDHHFEQAGFIRLLRP
jgi:predicted nucleic acid-binding protein